MHNKIHSVISPLFRIKNVHTETGWNAPIPMPVWIVTAETEYLLSEQKKFQNKSKNIYEVYQSVFFRCIMLFCRTGSFSFVMFFTNSLYIRKSCTIFFYEKVVKWCSHNILAIKIPIELALIVSLVLYRPTSVYEL